MFTGIIEQQGRVLANEQQGLSHRLVVSSPFIDLLEGESIAVNGVCLTVVPAEKESVHFDLSPETLKVTTLESLVVGDLVNLERAMLASTRFGGHYVSGHVDAQSHVKSIQPQGDFVEVELAGFSLSAMRFLLPKGSITVEGVSLTINKVSHEHITLMLVPHTLNHTTLRFLKPGQSVNIEFDYLTRIVAHQIQLFETFKEGAL